MLGIGFTVPGEWGIDHTDTNGVLPEQERYRGRERRVAFANLQPNFNHTQAGHLESDWYRNDLSMSVAPDKNFQTGGGFSFYYETDNGMRYGVNVQGLVNVFKKDKSPTDRDAGLKVTLGAAYREDARADTIAAVDLELHWTDSSRVQTRLFGGVERSFSKERGFLRLGSMNGMPTYGAGVRFGSARFDYAIVKNLLPKITGQDVPAFQDGHFLSYTVETN